MMQEASKLNFQKSPNHFINPIMFNWFGLSSPTKESQLVGDIQELETNHSKWQEYFHSQIQI